MSLLSFLDTLLRENTYSDRFKPADEEVLLVQYFLFAMAAACASRAVVDFWDKLDNLVEEEMREWILLPKVYILQEK
ncbi:hypothetical protein Tco_0408250 [Tanacetum coccineum]